MRCNLNLHLRSAHEKPQQLNRFDSPTDPGKKERTRPCKGAQSYQIIKVHKSSQKILFIAKSYKVLFAWFKWWNPQDSPMAFKFCDPGAHITYLMILYLPWS